MILRKFLFILIPLLFGANCGFGQSIDTVLFSFVSEHLYDSFLPYSCYSAKFDDEGRPYIYTANVEMGIVVFDVSDIQNPEVIDIVPPADLGGLKPTNLWHENGLLYASVGGIQGVAQNAGLAILDVSNPSNLVVLDTWTDPTYNQGAAIVIVDGNYAYVGAMELGVIVLNVSDPSAISFEGHAALDPNFPQTPGLFSTPNARGMSIRNDTLIVANDAGGLRMVDVTDKQNPIELSKYINPDMNAITQSAYNNVLLVGQYAYIPVDYCGLDVVSVSDTAMESANWLNPWNCDGTNWNGAEGHSNEIQQVAVDLIFMTGGDSELLAYDISDRENPTLIGEYTFPYDSVVAWGVTANEQYVVLCLVDNSVFQQPYYSNVGGIRILEWNAVLGIDQIDEPTFLLYPNPTTDAFMVNLNKSFSIHVANLLGKTILNDSFYGVQSIPTTGWSPGIYMVRIAVDDAITEHKLIIK